MNSIDVVTNLRMLGLHLRAIVPMGDQVNDVDHVSVTIESILGVLTALLLSRPGEVTLKIDLRQAGEAVLLLDNVSHLKARVGNHGRSNRV